MPSSWPAEALRAQAVVARSYALRSRRSGVFDVYADVRSQMYRGLAGEAATTTAAVRATRAKVVFAAGEVAQTFFFSTSGGRTAAVEEEWGGEPLSYLRSVDDPHDDLSPYHTWRARLTERQVRRALSGLVSGQLPRPVRRHPHDLRPRRHRGHRGHGRHEHRAGGDDPHAARPAQHLVHHPLIRTRAAVRWRDRTELKLGGERPIRTWWPSPIPSRGDASRAHRCICRPCCTARPESAGRR